MADITLTDSGEREEFPTGSRRDTREGKGRYDLVPPRAMFLLARVYEEGAKKYGERNWEKGQPVSRYFDSALRHMYNALEGKMDENHVANACFNVMAILETLTRIAEGTLPEELDDIGLAEQFRSNPGYKQKHGQKGEFPVDDIEPKATTQQVLETFTRHKDRLAPRTLKDFEG